jgi:hypothetical protein
MIRPLTKNNYNLIKRIYEKHYKEEFDLPDFINNFICAFNITNQNEEIISVVSVRTIAEAIVLTDKDKSLRDRAAALKEGLAACKVITYNSGYDQLHAFIQDDIWLKRLKKEGFKDCKGNAIYLNVGE